MCLSPVWAASAFLVEPAAQMSDDDKLPLKCWKHVSEAGLLPVSAISTALAKPAPYMPRQAVQELHFKLELRGTRMCCLDANLLV